eukprot:5676747-Pleurochrysis_carterae.AAC.2
MSMLSISLSFGVLLLGSLLLGWAVQILWNAVSSGRKGYFLSTSVACVLSATANVCLWANVLLHSVYPYYPSDSTMWELLMYIFTSAHGTLLILGALNLSLMWIEFIIASKRLLPVGHNLRLTASFLFWYMVCFTITAIIGVVVGSTVNHLGFLFWVISTYATVLVLVVLLTVGTVRMSAVLLREAGRVKENNIHMERVSRVEHNLKLSQRLRARAENIVSCSRRIRAACLCYMVATCGYYLAQLMHAPAVLVWLLLLCIDISMCAAQWAMMSCVKQSMEIDRRQSVLAVASIKASDRSLQQGSKDCEAPDLEDLKEQMGTTGSGCNCNASDNISTFSVTLAVEPRPQVVTASAGVRTWSEECASAPPELIV